MLFLCIFILFQFSSVITWRHTDLLAEYSGKIIQVIKSAGFRNILYRKRTCIEQVNGISNPFLIDIRGKAGAGFFFEYRR